MTGCRKAYLPGKHRAAGFSLIEVMIAVLVLGVGLLGFALMQTMNVRFAQSANYRTQATNLTYELLDQMRINRVLISEYLGDYAATTAAADCIPQTGTDLSPALYRVAWQCRLGRALGDGASAAVVRDGDEIVVSISWGDERWTADAEDLVFETRTRL